MHRSPDPCLLPPPTLAGETAMAHPLTDEDTVHLEAVQGRLENTPADRRHLIPVLQMVQECVGYLPPQSLSLVAAHLNLTVTEVYGVASFYNQFRFTPPGRHPVKICMGTACHVRGGDIILENFERKLDIAEGETTPDREFSIERVACVGCCALAPVAVVGEDVHGHMAPSKVEGLVIKATVEQEKRARAQAKEGAESADVG
jgi:NADH-quinone oxidoreductase subunit E